MSMISTAREMFSRNKGAPARQARQIRRSMGGRSWRGFDAGVVSRLTADFQVSDQTSNEAIRNGLRLMRARSRDLFRNNDYAKKYAKMLVSNVVGPNGIKLQMRVPNDDRSGGYDTGANDMIETAFKKWSKQGVCTMDGRLSWVAFQKLWIQNIARDGEVFVQLVEGRRAGPFGFAIQFIEPELLDHDLNGTHQDRRIRLGIEVDEWDKPVAYWFLNDNPGDPTAIVRAGRKYRRVTADQILHCFDPVEIGAWRGVPWLHAGMVRLKMLAGYEEAELVAARTAASKMGFITSESGEGYEADGEAEDGSLITDVEPGVIEQLPENYSFESFDPQHPMSQFGDFLKSMLRGVAAGLGTVYNYLAGDLEGVNFSSLRQGNLMENDQWRIIQKMMIEGLHVPVFEKWLLSALGSAELVLPASRFVRFNAATWQPRGWAWVDPVKESNANLNELSMGVTSRTVIAAAAGRDIEEVFKDLLAEKELAEKMGIVLADPASLEGAADPGEPTTEGANA